MPHRYFVFTNLSPADTRITLAHDSGWGGTAVPATDPQGRAGSVFDLPDSVPNNNGAQLNLDAANKVPLQVRGVLTYSDVDPTRAYLQVDDFVLVDAPTTPEPPPGPTPGPTPSTPLEVINAVYASGLYNLGTKPGCGEFTEACAWELSLTFGPMWGHLMKDPGQNQYPSQNGHAVDAVQAIYGEHTGVWDIIVSSVSPNAYPAFNDAGDSNPEKFAPAFPPASVTRLAQSLAEVLSRLLRILRH